MLDDGIATRIRLFPPRSSRISSFNSKAEEAPQASIDATM